MASRDDHSSASSFSLRVTGPAVRWLVTRPVREAAIVHGRWLRMTITRVLPRLHFGLLGLRPGCLIPSNRDIDVVAFPSNRQMIKAEQRKLPGEP
jgi:hypothetical protein